MSMNTSFIPERELLELSFDGNLDLTITQEVCGVIRILPQLQDGLKTCVLDLTPIERVFDSGVALLWMLSRDLRRAGAAVVVVGDHPEIRRRLSLIRGDTPHSSRPLLAAAVGSV